VRPERPGLRDRTIIWRNRERQEMYEAHFGFSERPFAAAPQVEHYFPADSAQRALERLARCIERAEGPGLLVGPAGTGKTLVCRLLAARFRDRLQVALLPSARLGSPKALLQAILYELGRPYRGMDEGELRLSLVDFITTSRECASGMLLLIDEAHGMPLRLIEEARLLTNLGTDGRPLVRLVLAGGCALEERLAGPKLESLNQRIVARCYLEAFNSEETTSYIHQRIEAAGAKPEDVFPEASCERVYQATDGVPRLVNQVCDHALLLAYAAGRYTLDPALVEEAWADLQQLPTPWNGESAGACSSGVVEFGTLEEPGETSDASVGEPTAEGGSRGVVEPQSVCSETQDDWQSDFGGQGASLELGVGESGEAESDRLPSDPSQRIDQIEGLLAEAEAEFQPAGRIGPEVELVFDEPDRPFREPFAEEEIVPQRGKPAGSMSAPAGPAPETAASIDWEPSSHGDEEACDTDQTDSNQKDALVQLGTPARYEPETTGVAGAETSPGLNPTGVSRRYARLFSNLRKVSSG